MEQTENTKKSPHQFLVCYMSQSAVSLEQIICYWLRNIKVCEWYSLKIKLQKICMYPSDNFTPGGGGEDFCFVCLFLSRRKKDGVTAVRLSFPLDVCCACELPSIIGRDGEEKLENFWATQVDLFSTFPSLTWYDIHMPTYSHMQLLVS